MAYGRNEKRDILELSPKELEEYAKCKKSYYYFVTNYVYIRDKKGKIVKFQPWPKQEKLLRSLEEKKWVLCPASRQIGKSVLVGSFALWLGMFQPNSNIVVMSNKGEQAKKFLKKVKIILKYLPDFITKTLKINDIYPTDNVHTLEFANRSIIESINTTEEGPRGDSLSLVIWDECAFTPENIQDELWSAVSPAVNDNRLILISTFKNDDPNNLFYRLYTNRNNKFFIIDDMDWTTDPNRTPKWYEDEKSTYKNNLAKFHREYDLIPSIVENCEFNIMKLLELEKQCQDPEVFDEEIGIKIFEDAIPGVEYIIGVDGAEGVLGNDHGIQVFRLDKLIQVAEFRNNQISYGELSNVIANLGEMYNDALVVVENNNIGHAILEILENTIGYENLYVGEDGNLGVRTTSSSKETMVSYCANAITYDLIHFKSRDLIRQLRTYKKKLTSSEKSKKSDDLVYALLVILYAIGDLYLSDSLIDGLKDKIRNSTDISSKIKLLRNRSVKNDAAFEMKNLPDPRILF